MTCADASSRTPEALVLAVGPVVIFTGVFASEHQSLMVTLTGHERLQHDIILLFRFIIRSFLLKTSNDHGHRRQRAGQSNQQSERHRRFME